MRPADLFLCAQNRVEGVLGRSVCETSIMVVSQQQGSRTVNLRMERDQDERSFHPEEKPGREQGDKGWQVQTSGTMHLHRVLHVMYELV